ncbi:MAG TPA: hypothetical protein VJX23_10225, partial [Candidatus Binataceae bacterium]|nr:hypothetical protein [Candidatus Binataceae bacterium]
PFSSLQTPAIAFHSVILRHPPPSGCELGTTRRIMTLFYFSTNCTTLPTSNAPEREQTDLTAEVVLYGDEWIVVIWAGPRSAATVGSVNRFEEEDGRIARIWEYYFCPETIAEIARELSAKPSNNGYHHTPEISSRVIASAVLPWSPA